MIEKSTNYINLSNRITISDNDARCVVLRIEIQEVFTDFDITELFDTITITTNLGYQTIQFSNYVEHLNIKYPTGLDLNEILDIPLKNCLIGYLDNGGRFTVELSPSRDHENTRVDIRYFVNNDPYYSINSEFVDNRHYTPDHLISTFRSSIYVSDAKVDEYLYPLYIDNYDIVHMRPLYVADAVIALRSNSLWYIQYNNDHVPAHPTYIAYCYEHKKNPFYVLAGKQIKKCTSYTKTTIQQYAPKFLYKSIHNLLWILFGSLLTYIWNVIFN